MLDEWGLKAVDWAVEAYERWAVPWRSRLRRSAVGFRLTIAAQAAARTVGLLLGKLVHADSDGGFLQRLIMEPAEEKKSPGFGSLMSMLMARGNVFFSGRTFAYLLLLTMLSACLLCAGGQREMAVLCAFFCLHWLAAAMDEDYEPICAGIRQRYLAGQLLRGGAYLTLLLDYVAAYAQRGLSTNVVLQSTMAVTMVIHAALFFSFVAFNRRQQIFARVLSGVLGFAPALACAAGAALGASTIAGSLPEALGGIFRAAGVALAFFSHQAEMVDRLGGNRLKYGRLWHGLTMTTGFFMMLGGAWLTAL